MSKILTSDRLARLAAAADQAGAHWTAGLFRGALRGDVDLFFVMQGERVPQAALDANTRHRPVIVILSGDVPGQPNPGPGEFPGVWRAFQWAHAMVFHAAAGNADQAHDVLLIAAVVRKVLVVETGTTVLQAWHEARDKYGPHAPSLTIAPPDGGMHPVETAPVGAVMQ